MLPELQTLEVFGMLLVSVFEDPVLGLAFSAVPLAEACILGGKGIGEAWRHRRPMKRSGKDFGKRKLKSTGG